MPPDFSKLNFASFQRMAKDASLSPYEKVGFPDSYRKGFGDAIMADIMSKLSLLEGTGKTVLDIGPGCSDLPHLLIAHCRKHEHRLLLTDCAQMLALLPDDPYITKIPGMFPGSAAPIHAITSHGVDVILCYSVLHHLILDADLYDTLDHMMQLLKPGGEMLLGDIPNASMRQRFFTSVQGKALHRQFLGTDASPDVPVPAGASNIDDTAILSIVRHLRAKNMDAFILPQAPNLPMANRREDILIRKP